MNKNPKDFYYNPKEFRGSKNKFKNSSKSSPILIFIIAFTLGFLLHYKFF